MGISFLVEEEGGRKGNSDDKTLNTHVLTRAVLQLDIFKSSSSR